MKKTLFAVALLSASMAHAAELTPVGAEKQVMLQALFQHGPAV